MSSLGGFVVVVYANPGPSSSMYGEAGIYPGAPSYTVWREGSTYYAKDANGEIPSWGETSNFTVIFENVVDNLPVGGGRITLRTANYTGTMIIDRSNVIVEGEGAYGNVPLGSDPGKAPDWLSGTVIRPTSSGDDGIYISGENRTGIQIRNLGIWFSEASTGSGITTDMDTKFHLKDATFENIMVLELTQRRTQQF